MPHVVLEGDIDLSEFASAATPLNTRDADGIRKVSDIYINAGGTSLLLESVVVADGKTQKFMINVTKKGSGATVRLLPLTDPEKSRGVKQLMGEVASQMLEMFPGTTVGKTNLQDFV